MLSYVRDAAERWWDRLQLFTDAERCRRDHDGAWVRTLYQEYFEDLVGPMQRRLWYGRLRDLGVVRYSEARVVQRQLKYDASPREKLNYERRQSGSGAGRCGFALAKKCAAVYANRLPREPNDKLEAWPRQERRNLTLTSCTYLR